MMINGYDAMNVFYMTNLYKVVLLSCCVSGAATMAQAGIYQSKDKQGVTLFTDMPEKLPSSAAVTKLEDKSVSVVPAYRENQHDGGVEPYQGQPHSTSATSPVAQQKSADAVNYRVKLISPLHESTFRRGVGSVDVSVAVSPALQSGAQLQLAIDDKVIGNGSHASYDTANIYRGAHTASAKVIDSQGRTLASDSVTFYVHQRSKIIDEKRKAAEKKKQEAKKPWWQRQINNLRRKVI